MKVYFHLNLDGFSNSYVVTNPTRKEAIIIDPCKINKEILELLEKEKYKLVAILITHNHESHLRGLEMLRKIYTPKIYAADYEVAPSNTIVLKGDGVLKLAGLHVGYMSLPGHSADSMVFRVNRILFTGDAITAGLIGSTNSSYAHQTLISNLKTKILSQQNDMIIMPGHGPPTTIGVEKLNNLAFECPTTPHEGENAV